MTKLNGLYVIEAWLYIDKVVCALHMNVDLLCTTCTDACSQLDTVTAHKNVTKSELKVDEVCGQQGEPV